MSRFFTIATIAAALALGPALASTAAHAKGNPKNNEQNAMLDLLDLQLQFLEDQHTKIVFASSAKPNGDLMTAGGGATGLEGADNICTDLAVAAGLPGTYTAFLSDDNTDARDRVTQFPFNYELVDGTSIADSFADLIDCTEGAGTNECLDFSIRRDEDGFLASNSAAWTATATDGTRLGPHNCLNWTSSDSAQFGRSGNTNDIVAKWVDDQNRRCDVTVVRLYCFQD